MPNKKPKILFLIQLPPPVHGASMMNDFIRQSIKINDRFECNFLNISIAEDLSDVGKFKMKKVFRLLALFYNISKLLRNYNPDMVYITLSPHGKAFYKDAIITFLSKTFHRKTIFHLHGKGIKDNIKYGFKKWIYTYTFKNVYVIHLSPLLKDDLNLVLDKDTSIQFIPNGIPDYLTDIKKSKRSEEIVKLIYLSNFIPAKGALLAIKAVHNLILLGIKNIHFDLIGRTVNSDYLNILKQYVADNNLNNYITFHSSKYGQEKISALENAEIFILPSKNECFPISIIEAMMCGLSIISTDEGAIPELVRENECGLLSNPSDLDSLTKNLNILVVNKELRTLYGNNARLAFSNKYTIQIFEESFIEIINNIFLSNEFKGSY